MSSLVFVLFKLHHRVSFNPLAKNREFYFVDRMASANIWLLVLVLVLMVLMVVVVAVVVVMEVVVVVVVMVIEMCGLLLQ